MFVSRSTAWLCGFVFSTLGQVLVCPVAPVSRLQVVTKLFHIVEPDVAVFGQKDYQQWRLITRMVRDLDLPIKIIGMPIAREEDGLAMSR